VANKKRVFSATTIFIFSTEKLRATQSFSAFIKKEERLNRYLRYRIAEQV
jgi:hypothetical protein